MLPAGGLSGAGGLALNKGKHRKEADNRHEDVAS
jgi:hypothetical protein